MYAAWQEYWLLYHKCIFDGENSLIYVAPHVTSIDVQTDLYSDYKEWKAVYDNTKFLEAIRTVGGDPTTGGDALGASFFLTNGWRIVVDHGIDFDGNLFSDDYSSPFITESGVELAQSKVSNLIDQAAVDADQIGPAVWAGNRTTYNQAGTMGEAVNEAASYSSTLIADGVALTSAEGFILTKIFKRLGLDPSDVLHNKVDRVYTESSAVEIAVTGDPTTHSIFTSQS